VIPGHRPRKRFGQHFLVPAWADKVVDAIAPSAADRFLEIGPGPGILTERLAPRAAHVTAIEIDRDLASSLQQRVPSNVEVVTGDFLDVDLAPYVADGPIRVAGNLPYNVSSPILFRLLAEKRGQPPFPEITQIEKRGLSPFSPETESRKRGLSPFSDATLMLQREVADRLVARPGTKDYGVLTILTAVHADVTQILRLPPGAFRPAPKVHSAVVRLTFKESAVPDDLNDTFTGMVRSMFTQRRKTLANALAPFAGSSTRAALESVEIDPVRRPETLTVPELIELARAVSRKP